MLKNYITIAVRNILKHKMYAEFNRTSHSNFKITNIFIKRVTQYRVFKLKKKSQLLIFYFRIISFGELLNKRSFIGKESIKFFIEGVNYEVS